ncbi:hypothetical protein J2S62_002097 [Enteractinococcus fodinae]|uniref:Uncharacterized protein n=1 Tax=Enteractinococcus fodinae TaxID=684663 RepID=A0ABU2B2K1_9MICC|nr:hypothetical protein [Enteractinococcus fodinae]
MTCTSHSVSSAAVTYDQLMSGVYTGIITAANRPRAMFAIKAQHA